MGITIGIDIGGSTTKIVGIEHGEIKRPMFVRATDPVTSLFGAFGKYLYLNEIKLGDIEHVMITGVGGAYVTQPLYDLPTTKADEFLSNGLGGKYLAHLDNMIIVSMGTGTALVKVMGNQIEHIGGIGIGGGTILGLSKLLLKTNDFQRIVAMAEKGDLSHIDLLIKDITRDAMPGLPLEATASNFGKTSDEATPEDIALGIINMVLQCIGKSAILSSQNSGIRDFILIGNLVKLPQCNQVFPVLEKMFSVHFLIPTYAEYATAIGAALSYQTPKSNLIIT